MSKNIYVTKTYLPPLQDFNALVAEIWESGQLTNQGQLVGRFEQQVKQFLDVKNFQFVSNGTMALQLALRALDITEGEVITTPFSYVATTSAILWERCTPIFVDIDESTLCIDVSKIEAAITKDTKAIVAVHVFGNPCDIEAIEEIAKKHKLKVIYDAAHAFGASYKDKSLLDYGDVSISSFHATKLLHTIEGGCLVAKDKAVNEKIDLLKRFGHDGDDHFMLGINGKASEFQAAMGLCNLKYVNAIISERKRICNLYDELLGANFRTVSMPANTTRNYAYYPIILNNEKQLKKIMTALEREKIFPRRYFFPSLNLLPYLESAQACPVSEDISSRIICLPLYTGLSNKDIKRICTILKNAL